MMVAVSQIAFEREPETDEEYEEAIEELTSRFSEWVSVQEFDSEPELPEVLLHYKWRFVDGHLTRWRRNDLSEIYLEIYPAKVVAEADDLDEILEWGRTFLVFLDESALLDAASEPADVLVTHLDHLASHFRSSMADVARYSPAKRFTMAALAEGVDLGDQREVEAFMARFNTRTRAERELVMGPTPRRWAGAGSSGRITAPGTPPRPPSTKRRKRRR
jgi:hypothetical protein